jgi:hypothetical protein
MTPTRITAAAMTAVAALLLAAAPARAATVSRAVWHFDEPAGSTVARDSGNMGLQASLLDPRYRNVSFGHVDPVVGSYAHFDMGVLVTAPAPSPGTRNVTITMTARTSDPIGYANYVQAGTFTNPHGFWKIEETRRSPGGQFRCRFNGSLATIRMQLGPGINDGRWHTVSCIKRATYVEEIIDRVVVGHRNVAVGSILTGNERISIGGKYTPNAVVDPADMVHGDIAEVSVTFG